MSFLCRSCHEDEESEYSEDEEDPRTWQRGVSTVEQKEITVPIRKRDPRTTKDAAVPPKEALELLKEGNKRFASGMGPLVRAPLGEAGRQALVDHGQRPSAIVLGCADSRAPIDTVFDSQPGDLFILRNAGNTLVEAAGSVVGSMEYAVAHLESKLILVLGHSNCGAIAGATKVMLSQKDAPKAAAPAKKPSALESLLDGLTPVAAMTQAQLPAKTSEAEIANKAIKVNVFHSMANILLFSKLIREKVKAGEVEIHGGVYDLKSGKVEFLGQHPMQKATLLEIGLSMKQAGIADSAVGA